MTSSHTVNALLEKPTPNISYPKSCTCTKQIPQRMYIHNMKFPRPRNLLINEYPDLTTEQPELFCELVQQFVHPPPQSNMESYITASIDFLKNEQ